MLRRLARGNSREQAVLELVICDEADDTLEHIHLS